MRRNTGLTLEQHEALGRRLQTMRDDLCVILCKLGEAYPCKDKYGGVVSKCLYEIDYLRGRLDYKIHKEHRDLPCAAKIYYRVDMPGYGMSEFAKSFKTAWHENFKNSRKKTVNKATLKEKDKEAVHAK